MKESHKKTLILIGFSYSVGLSLYFYYIFMVTYLHGFRVILDINHFNEAFVELILFTFLVQIMLLGLYYYIKQPVEKENDK